MLAKGGNDMSDTLKAISIVTAMHQCFVHLRDSRPEPVRRSWKTFWKKPTDEITIKLERNYDVVHRALPYLEAIVLGEPTDDRHRVWVNQIIETMAKSLGHTGHHFVVDSGSLEVVFEVETTEDGTVYGFLVQKSVPTTRRSIRKLS
jgi:hypothetical protein